MCAYIYKVCGWAEAAKKFLAVVDLKFSAEEPKDWLRDVGGKKIPDTAAIAD